MVHGAWNENPYGYILVGGIPTPLKNMSSSVGMMAFTRYGKIQNVPNHQSEIFYVCVYIYILYVIWVSNNGEFSWDLINKLRFNCI